MITISGASGNVGGEAARIFREAGVPVRAIVRRASAAALRGHDVIVADYGSPSSLRAAIGPGDQVFMVSVYEGHAERLVKHQNFIDAASDAGAQHLVYLSFINAAADAEFSHAVSHYDTEQLIIRSGLPYTFLRTSLYQASVPWFYVDGVCEAPAGDGAASWVSRRDVGAAVAAVLRDPSAHAGATYSLTGPEALTMVETTERINALLGLDFRYADIDEYENLGVRGLPDPVGMKSYRRSCFTSIAVGQQSLVTDHIQRLTGVAPARIDRHILTYPEQFTDPKD